jgi:hypothetical protein
MRLETVTKKEDGGDRMGRTGHLFGDRNFLLDRPVHDFFGAYDALVVETVGAFKERADPMRGVSHAAFFLRRSKLRVAPLPIADHALRHIEVLADLVVHAAEHRQLRDLRGILRALFGLCPGISASRVRFDNAIFTRRSATPQAASVKRSGDGAGRSHSSSLALVLDCMTPN